MTSRTSASEPRTRTTCSRSSPGAMRPTASRRWDGCRRRRPGCAQAEAAAIAPTDAAGRSAQG
eukprot:12424715-Alexandrium_andersonii.AAC.1